MFNSIKPLNILIPFHNNKEKNQMINIIEKNNEEEIEEEIEIEGDNIKKKKKKR